MRPKGSPEALEQCRRVVALLKLSTKQKAKLVKLLPKGAMAHGYRTAISGIAVSPKRLHCTLYYLLYEDNIQGEEVKIFLRHLLRACIQQSEPPLFFS